MLFSSKRICNKCEESKPLSAYRKDSKGRDGYAVRCTECKKAKTVSIPIQEEPIQVVKDYAKELLDQMDAYCDSMLEGLPALTKKYPKHKVLSWNEKGATLQIFSSPILTFKGKDTEDVIQKALRY